MWSLRTSPWKPSGEPTFVRNPHCLRGGRGSGRHVPGPQVEGVEHVGSAHTDAELALLLAAARERLSPGQGVLDLGDLPVVPARMDEVADWTGEPELPLQPSTPAAGGRPAAVSARRAARAANSARTPQLPLALPLRRRQRRSAGAKIRNPWAA